MTENQNSDKTAPMNISSSFGSEDMESKPSDISAGGEISTSETISDSIPKLVPPGETEVQEYSAGVTAWYNTQKIGALWCINESRNSWINIIGKGWRKLANNSDSAIVALTLIASSAKQNQSNVNYREESNGMIHEIYVW